MEEKIVLGKKMESWRKYREALTHGEPAEIVETLQDYQDHAGVRVKIQNPREALEAQIHDNKMGIRNPHRAILTPAAMQELESMIRALANQLLSEVGTLAWIKTLRENKGEGDVIITEEVVRLAYLDILSYSDDELVEEYNTKYKEVMGVEE